MASGSIGAEGAGATLEAADGAEAGRGEVAATRGALVALGGVAFAIVGCVEDTTAAGAGGGGENSATEGGSTRGPSGGRARSTKASTALRLGARPTALVAGESPLFAVVRAIATMAAAAASTAAKPIIRPLRAPVRVSGAPLEA